MSYSQPMMMSTEEHQRLMEWWNATESAKLVVQRLMSLISELRVHHESSHADGMVLFYRAASEISYGNAGMRGCIRRFFTNEYSKGLRKNSVMSIVLRANMQLTQKCFWSVLPNRFRVHIPCNWLTVFEKP